jgi:hypothetical protein
MKTYEVTFIKGQNLVAKNQPVQLARQFISTNEPKFNIPVPLGYGIMTICEILEPLIIGKQDEKAKN